MLGLVKSFQPILLFVGKGSVDNPNPNPRKQARQSTVKYYKDPPTVEWENTQGRVFNFKLDCFVIMSSLYGIYTDAHI